MTDAYVKYTKSDVEIVEDYFPSMCFKLIDGKPRIRYSDNNIMCFSVMGFDVYSQVFAKVCPFDYFGDTEVPERECREIVSVLKDYMLYSDTCKDIGDVFSKLGIYEKTRIDIYGEFLNEAVFHNREAFLNTTKKLIGWIENAVDKKGYITIEGI